jgi:hypothetical protein
VVSSRPIRGGLNTSCQQRFPLIAKRLRGQNNAWEMLTFMNFLANKLLRCTQQSGIIITAAEQAKRSPRIYNATLRAGTDFVSIFFHYDMVAAAFNEAGRINLRDIAPCRVAL